MIYISEAQLNQVEYLISQSLNGNHVLFDPETIRNVFRKNDVPTVLTEEEAYSVEHHIEHIIESPTLQSKRAYIENLSPDVFERVVKTYFSIVENNLYENLKVKH